MVTPGDPAFTVIVSAGVLFTGCGAHPLGWRLEGIGDVSMLLTNTAHCGNVFRMETVDLSYVGLDARSLNALYNHEIKTLDDLERMLADKKHRRVKNFGPISLRNTQEAISEWYFRHPKEQSIPTPSIKDSSSARVNCSSCVYFQPIYSGGGLCHFNPAPWPFVRNADWCSKGKDGHYVLRTFPD